MQQTMGETHSKRGTHQATREVVGWTNIDQPGFYVNKTSGQGFRITRELLIPGASPALSFLGADKDRFVLIKVRSARFEARLTASRTGDCA